MLVLSRKKNETVMIGDDIKVFVIEIRGDQVRLGFEAPKDVPVHRKEIYDLTGDIDDQRYLEVEQKILFERKEVLKRLGAKEALKELRLYLELYMLDPRCTGDVFFGVKAACDAVQRRLADLETEGGAA